MIKKEHKAYVTGAILITILLLKIFYDEAVLNKRGEEYVFKLLGIRQVKACYEITVHTYIKGTNYLNRGNLFN